MARRSAAWLTVLLLGVATWRGAGAAPPELPTHLELLAAAIEQPPPTDRLTVIDRRVVLWVEVAAAPPCDGTTPPTTYGFLIDADRDASTSFAGDLPSRNERAARRALAKAGFDSMGIDARIVARCNPTTGEFESALGPVAVTALGEEGSTRIEIETVAQRLPSAHFHWVAYAASGRNFARLPGALDRRDTRQGTGVQHATWATLEIGRN